MTPNDRAALEIGRLFMRAHTAEARAEVAEAERNQAKTDLAALQAERTETAERVEADDTPSR